MSFQVWLRFPIRKRLQRRERAIWRTRDAFVDVRFWPPLGPREMSD